METVKCEYCGRIVDIRDMGTLDNGSPACQKCVELEEEGEKERENHGK